MKITLLCTLLFFSFKVESQFYLGLTKKDVLKAIYTKEKVEPSKIDDRYDKYNNNYLGWRNAPLHCNSYVIFKKGLSFALTLVPDNTNVFNVLVKGYNDNFIIISDLKWKCYVKERIIYINAGFNTDDNSYFIVFSQAQ